MTTPTAPSWIKHDAPGCSPARHRITNSRNSIEKETAEDSRVLVNAEGDGIVEYVDANEIVIRYTRSEDEKLISFDDDIRHYPPYQVQANQPEHCVNLKPM
jgi:DNA-directed RNA polymerase subunit beta